VIALLVARLAWPRPIAWLPRPIAWLPLAVAVLVAPRPQRGRRGAMIR